MEILSMGLGICILLIIVWLVVMVLAFFLKVAIDFLPATVLAVVVFLLTWNIIYALVTFGVVGLIMVVARGSRRRGRYC